MRHQSLALAQELRAATGKLQRRTVFESTTQQLGFEMLDVLLTGRMRAQEREALRCHREGGRIQQTPPRIPLPPRRCQL